MDEDLLDEEVGRYPITPEQLKELLDEEVGKAILVRYPIAPKQLKDLSKMISDECRGNKTYDIKRLEIQKIQELQKQEE
ncbi:MAG: hypothetical protein AB4368_02600 [Xenococcaceae cyanobacterium]